MAEEKKIARLILECGTVFTGKVFGAAKESYGEVVFNTSMTGYQEILTDPSYCGQIITMTYPMIGNYGINRDDFEAVRPFVHGFAVRKHCNYPSNWRAQYTLDYVLKEYDIPGIYEIDTRKLTRIIREHGTMKGIISVNCEPVEDILKKINKPLQTNQVELASTKNIFSCPGRGPRIVLVDFGSKHGILRELIDRHCDVIVVPYNTSFREIKRIDPDGIVLSNGPGDPKDVPEAISMVKQILKEYPLFGICLGHQILALACGANTEKMKFGHRGGNHPVKDLSTGKTYITSHNHSYAVTPKSLSGTNLIVTHKANNDGTIEGLAHKIFPVFSIQYHPEASPGPYDSIYLFEQFLTMVKEKIEKKVKQHA